jgi:RNA recognition motif-containing protein
MSKKIYVGNLNYETTDSTLTELFSKYGTVLSTKIIEDQFTGKSKGFAFIEMEKEEEAFKAITELNSKEVNGRSIKVNEAIEKQRKSNNHRNNFKKNNHTFR